MRSKPHKSITTLVLLWPFRFQHGAGAAKTRSPLPNALIAASWCWRPHWSIPSAAGSVALAGLWNMSRIRSGTPPLYPAMIS
jgi:hypothetical protein